MKKRWKNILIAIIMVISAFSIIHHTASQDVVENEELLEYWDVASTNSLGTYFTSTDPIEVAFYPTVFTENAVGRWRIIADIYEEVTYPEEAINNNDWLEADAILQECFDNMRMAGKDDDTGVIIAFIYSGGVTGNLQQKFNRAGIEYEYE
ncbi:hypothetical protein HXA34_01770 [Salipaludibacillus agaradhaerens]|jgi:hypothetical protein|uniref:hypothetical protein n=1 Tax=Salipaludibacillus agaradhaerens TaxID=76935 RepID=UPI002151F594|nr:hypothetical protein [Salipaludibacillus agaradhaerens]MCR6105012.1 hypothetical protein [Salipaludibacillus agaradhaerens]MCR6117057.1 hypothetical protein [Salipaludibacillus agaradhaerens]